MLNADRNLILDIINNDGNIINRLQILGEGTYIGSSKAATWGSASNGKILLSSDVQWDISSSATVYAVDVVGTGNTTRAENIASVNLGTPKDVNTGDDFIIKSGLSLTVND